LSASDPVALRTRNDGSGEGRVDVQQGPTTRLCALALMNEDPWDHVFSLRHNNCVFSHDGVTSCA
jgi:hypothetical protein